MNDFEKMWNECALGEVISHAKTLGKKECEFIFNYWIKYQPKVVCEFGTQLGCSIRVFIEIAKWLNIPTQFHSWDIVNEIEFANKKDFTFHQEDISNKELQWFERYKPDLIFFDCHVYSLTYALIKICLEKKVNFIMHDVIHEFYERVQKESNNFTNFDITTTTWEYYLMLQLLSEELKVKDSYESENFIVNCIRERFGICVVEMKN